MSNRNIRFFLNLYLYLYLFKVQFNKGTSKAWTRILKNRGPGKEGSFYSWNIACQQYWLSEQICLELKIWMWSFLNKFSKYFLKIKILQNSPKNIHDAIFNLIKFQATLLKRGFGMRALCRMPSECYFRNS